MGHDHKKSVSLHSRLELRGGNGQLRLHDRKILIARTGSFLKGYEDGRPSYIVDKALRPSDLGTIKIELTPRRNQIGKEDETYIDLHASI